MKKIKFAKWIWVKNESKPDTYGEFYDEFIWEEGEINCLLSCDGDYMLYINGQYVASNQYGDYEWYKSYDNIDITPFLKKGKNSIAVLVWHFGTDSQRYIKAQAGLIFELQSNSEVLLASGENTRARYSAAYKQGAKKLVTRQLGFSFAYDATKEDEWKTTGKDFQSAVIVEKNCSFVERPIKKLELCKLVHGRVVLAESNHYIIDLGKETVGLVSLDFISPAVQKVVVAWGEDLQGNHVRQRIEHRDFSFDYVAKAGKNEYVNYMLRLGCRYLERYIRKKPLKLKALNEIRKDYKKMLDAGATSVWETIDGASAFDNAGSLCHGCSAIPVYYFCELKK